MFSIDIHWLYWTLQHFTSNKCKRQHFRNLKTIIFDILQGFFCYFSSVLMPFRSFSSLHILFACICLFSFVVFATFVLPSFAFMCRLLWHFKMWQQQNLDDLYLNCTTKDIPHRERERERERAVLLSFISSTRGVRVCG